MTKDEEVFLEKLEVFRQESAQCAQFLYTYLTIHAVASEDTSVRRGLNEEALVWNTVLGSLQTSIFIVLGRIFDPNGKHGPDAMLKAAERLQVVFSYSSLATRKQPSFAGDPRALADYMSSSFVPGKQEFSRLQRLVSGYRARFNASYKELRDRVFAHKVYVKSEKVQELFSKTNIDDLERMVTFLGRLHTALQDAFHNGSRLTLRPSRHSTQKMLASPRGRNMIKPVQDEITAAMKRVLDSIAIEPTVPDAQVSDGKPMEGP